MPNDKAGNGPQDRKRINIDDDGDIDWWVKKFGVSRAHLADAVDAVGTSAQAVADYLGKRL